MASMRERTMGLILLVVLVLGNWRSSCGIGGANAQLSPSECNQERRLIENSCRPVAFGAQPSAGCCQLVRAAHVECVCPYVTPKLAALVGAQRMIKLVRGCGRPVPPNFRCGSITTPP
ncbi:unnamed protein product [Coffea canephora]|uniref:Bifunctional inhibitor/plant lipid transfer protein/seed storage helical domain-containing protein n=1 Tax=Coffea canephora TaxID=49390 RepID=A0A068U429_COFCA|nr:uncharacterized protein LOC113691596 [Coffea arabica]CDP03077.1 unnamed protein product [Coffea canephora]